MTPEPGAGLAASRMQALRDDTVAGKHQDDGDRETNGQDEQRARVVPQIRPEHDRRAVLTRQADERVDVLLVNVDSCSECAADDSEREFKAVHPSQSDTKRESDRRKCA